MKSHPKYLLLKNRVSNYDETWHEHTLVIKIQGSSNEEAHHLTKRENCEIAKNTTSLYACYHSIAQASLAMKCFSDERVV